MRWWISAALLFCLLVLCRVCFVLWRMHRMQGSPGRGPVLPLPRRLSVVLGSGGHTAEMIRILSQLDLSAYAPRLYIVSAGDAHSARLAHALHQTSKTADSHFRLMEVPRARRVKQSPISTPPSALYSLFVCLYLFWSSEMASVDAVLMNGPGTCLPICMAAFARRFLGLRSPRLVYVESLARVKRLSLTARLIQPLVDVMLVQWPALAGKGAWYRCPRDYVGWLQ